MSNSPTAKTDTSCNFPKRVQPLTKPDSLLMAVTEENAPKIKEWLLNRYASSTFNKQLPIMSGLPIKLNMNPDGYTD